MFTRWFTYADDSSTHKGSTRVAQDVYRVGTQQNSETVLHGQKYVYNTNGNIAEIQDLNGNPLAEYAYDALGQLTEETIYTSSESSYTYLYTYDNAGNLLSRRVSGTTVEDVYQYTNTYWADMLTSFKGQTINYETATVSINGQTVTLRSGNPKTWYNYHSGSNHSYSNLTWAQGRQLVSLTKDSTTNISYAYDMEGVRSSKTVGTVTHNYVTQNGKVVRETWGSNVLWFVYDASGKPFSLLHSENGGSSWATYYYILNLQGDVVKLVSATGTVAATYTYDAWGQPLTSSGTMASVNPLRYRGYYYDSETGWYYLQSRYYDPIVKRFINADTFASTSQGFLGYNMFVYCNNNPIDGNDANGEFPWINLVVGFAIGAAVGAISAAVTGGSITDVAISAISSGVAGAVIGVTGSYEAGAAAGRVVGSAICAVGAYVDARVNGADQKTALACGAVTFGACLVTSYISGSVSVGNIAATALVDSTIGLGGSLCATAVSTGMVRKNTSVRKPSASSSRTTNSINTQANYGRGHSAHQAAIKHSCK